MIDRILNLLKPKTPANAICMECGGCHQNPSNACCINDHDNWLEIGDDNELFNVAQARFNVSKNTLEHNIRNCIPLARVN